jgi:WD40 repeat protein
MKPFPVLLITLLCLVGGCRSEPELVVVVNPTLFAPRPLIERLPPLTFSRPYDGVLAYASSWTTTLNLTTGEHLQYPTDMGGAGSLDWSSDGRRILKGTGYAVEIDLVTGVHTRLLGEPTEPLGFVPSTHDEVEWINANTLAHIASQGSEAGLYTYEFDTGQTKQLLSHFSNHSANGTMVLHSSHLDISNDGSQMLFIGRRYNAPGEPSDMFEALFTWPVACAMAGTCEPMQRTEFRPYRDFTITSARWSPNNSHIVMATDEGIFIGTLQIMNATDGTIQTLLGPVNLYLDDPAWSPNGQYIAYSTLDGSSGLAPVSSTLLCIVAVAGGQPDCIPPLENAALLGGGRLKWGPDVGLTIALPTAEAP